MQSKEQNTTAFKESISESVSLMDLIMLASLSLADTLARRNIVGVSALECCSDVKDRITSSVIQNNEKSLHKRITLYYFNNNL